MLHEGQFTIILIVKQDYMEFEQMFSSLKDAENKHDDMIKQGYDIKWVFVPKSIDKVQEFRLKWMKGEYRV